MDIRWKFLFRILFTILSGMDVRYTGEAIRLKQDYAQWVTDGCPEKPKKAVNNEVLDIP